MPRGRKIETWTFEHEGIVVKVPLRMYSDEHSVEFSAAIQEYDLQETGTDAEVIRESLYRQFVARASVAWKPYLRVCIGGHTQALRKQLEQRESELTLHIEMLQIGINNNGEMIHCQNVEEGTRRNIHIGSPAIGTVETGWSWSANLRGEGIAALIPDTPENRAALNAIIEAMKELLERLQAFLGQDQIEQTLLAVGASKFKLLAEKTEE